MANKQIVPIKGVQKLYYAVLEKDDNTGLTYSKPKYLKGIKKIQISPIYSEGTYYEESQLAFEEKSLDGYDVTIDITDVADEDLAELFGYELCEEGGYVQGNADTGKEIALLVKAKKAHGEFRYIVLYKGRLATGELAIEGEEGSPNYQAQTLSGKFVNTEFTKKAKYTVDSDSTGAPEDLDTKFFENVIIPTVKTVK